MFAPMWVIIAWMAIFPWWTPNRQLYLRFFLNAICFHLMRQILACVTAASDTLGAIIAKPINAITN